MPRNERRQPPQPDSGRFLDRLYFLQVAVGLTADRLAEAQGKLAHLPQADRAAVEEMKEIGKTSGELGAEADLLVAMGELNFSPDLKLIILDKVNGARTRRKGQPPTLPSGR